jgi:predicted signal transduction protein with EAL and GGDEF domain
VETSEQRDILLREGCRVGQGYYYSMPVTAEDFAWMLGEQASLPIGRPVRSRTVPGDRRPNALNSTLAVPGKI